MKPLDELTAHCIRCGFCLESCPTFVLTGEETESPRGRIYLVRSADEGKLDWEQTRSHIGRCLGCRACETACPSGVEYGQIFEIARDRLERDHAHKSKRTLLANLTDPGRIRLQLKLSRFLPGRRIPGLLSKLLSGQGPEADRPVAQPANTLPALAEDKWPPIRGEVYLLEGCVMRVLYPRVHEATRRLLRRVGYSIREVPQGCCGSLHLHAGYGDEARSRASALIEAMPGDLPVIVNSAGCGSTMKEYGQICGGKGSAFATRVQDASEFLFENGLSSQLRVAPGFVSQSPDATSIPLLRVTYHDACHLVHGQGVRSQPRELLKAIPGLELVDLKESDMCCGSAGIYNLTQPKLARELLERKWKNIEATGAEVVAMGNPGCHAWIGQAAREHGNSVRVLHTMELLEAAFIGLDSFV